jgi:hypothetical protein
MAKPVKKTTDYSAVLNRLKEQSKRGGDGDKANYIEFPQGDTRVRILPGHPHMDAFFVEVYYHTKQGRKDQTKVRCLNNGDIDGDACPVCEEVKAYYGSKDKDDKKLWQEQRPKNRFFMNAIDRSDATPEVKILACGTMVMTQLLGFVTDPDYGDVTDPETGLDIIINRTGEKLDTEYTVKPRRKSTPILGDEDEVAAILGTNAKDTQLIDLNENATAFEDEPENIMFIWENGWDAFKEKMKDEADEEEAKPKKKKKPAVDEDDEDEEPVAKPKKKAKPAPVEEEEDEEEEAPKPKKKKPAAPVEDDEDDDEEPVKPVKKKAKPAPVEEDDDEDEVPVKPKKKTKAPVEDDDEDDDLASLDAALAKTKAKAKK